MDPDTTASMANRDDAADPATGQSFISLDTEQQASVNIFDRSQVQALNSE
ncbi:hypothetical protein [Arthrobacter castelli]|nr:hypothetical protein [Arthrobacter castelli]